MCPVHGCDVLVSELVAHQRRAVTLVDLRPLTTQCYMVCAVWALVAVWSPISGHAQQGAIPGEIG